MSVSAKHLATFIMGALAGVALTKYHNMSEEEKEKFVAGLKEKAKKFNEMVEEMHGGWTSQPVVGGDYFSVAMGMDVTMKGMGRMNMDEVCVYRVQDGMIVSEQFFFTPGKM